MAVGKLSPIGPNVVEGLLKKKGSSSTKRSFRKIPARDGEKYTHREVCKGTILRTGVCISSLCSMGLWPKSRAELSRFSVQDIADGLLKLAGAGLEGEDWRDECNCRRCKFDISGAIRQQVDQVQKSINGICLRCLKMAEAGSEDCNLMVKCSKHEVEL